MSGIKSRPDIPPATVEGYKQKRFANKNHQGTTTKPVTVNREMPCLKTIFSKAVKNGKAERTLPTA
jgi:hypothetical protein